MIDITEVEDRYDVEPLKEIFYQLKEKNDMYFALALRRNITKEFFQFIKRQLDRNELINLNISGRTRSSKSTDATVIALWIIDYLKKKKGINKVFTPEYNFIFNISQFLNRFDNNTVEFHDIFIIDERKTYETIQAGSLYEEGQIKDIDRIAAKNCIHRINIIGSYDDISNNAFYSLVTYGKNYKSFTNKLIVFTREENERVALGYIEIPASRFLCADILNNRAIDCITCPKYSQDNFMKFNDKALNKIPKFSSCELLKAQYERMKDINIESVIGGDLEERTKIKIKVSYSFFTDKIYKTLKNKSQKKVYVQDNYFNYTNRRFTIQEIDEIVDRVEMIKTIEKDDSAGLMGFDDKGETDDTQENKK